MKKLLLTLLLLVAFRAYPQTYITNIRSGPSDHAILYAVNSFVNIYKDEKKERLAKEEATAKLNILRNSYESYQSFPESISDGWHSVVVTDNLKFCRDAKVYIENNRITQFVIDNCISLQFLSTGEIKNCKIVGTILKNSGEQIQVVEVYFAYDMESPKLVDPPVNPGYVCFWSSSEAFVGKKIVIDEMTIDGISSITKINKKKKVPECAESGTATLLMKPGRYHFRAHKSGNDAEGIFEIKSGECLIYRLK